MPNHQPVQFIQDDQSLIRFCREASQSAWVAIDTEFMRERTYYPKFCLLQMATPEMAACIDPLAQLNLQPVSHLLSDPGITKVFHAARQDIEILYHLFMFIPQPLFDTQLAAPLIGLPEQISYAALVAHYFGLTLDKGQSRTDWSARPLRPEQLSYAISDVTHLALLYPMMLQQLSESGRSDWLDDEFRGLLDLQHMQVNPLRIWERVSGLQQLQTSDWLPLQALAAWRESVSQEADLPRSWLLRDEVLIDLCRNRPSNLEALHSTRGLDAKLLARYGNDILACLAIEGEAPQHSAPRYGYKRTPDDDAKFERLMQVVRSRSVELGIPPTTLATRRDLELLMLDAHSSRVMQGWRRDALGHALEPLLD